VVKSLSEITRVMMFGILTPKSDTSEKNLQKIQKQQKQKKLLPKNGQKFQNISTFSYFLKEPATFLRKRNILYPSNLLL
jgi:hypothetical protein